MSHPILVVEDDRFQNKLLIQILQEKLGYNTYEAFDGRSALNILKTRADITLAVIDLYLPDIHGFELIDLITQRYPNLPIIVLSGSDEMQDAVTALKKGAIDFLNKPPIPERLDVSITNALKLNVLSQEVSRLRRETSATTKFEDLIGHDGGLASTITIARKAATSNIPVLISGETGVGKEELARAIHGESARGGNPFIAVNCGAIPENLVESTLFGHEKGAFTGAIAKSVGKFREAQGGTIFLDEIGELPLEIQVKLLRVLQQKEVEPVGGGAPASIDVRIISATNRDLPQEIQNGNFREDLFFRLEGLPIHIPPLRERKQDIFALADYFLDQFAVQENLTIKELDPAVQHYFQKRDWRGNIRELRNTLHRAMLLSEGHSIHKYDIEIIPQTNLTEPKELSDIDQNNYIQLIDIDGCFTSLSQLERQAMQKAVAHCKGNITQAAEKLGIAKSTFYRKWKLINQ